MFFFFSISFFFISFLFLFFPPAVRAGKFPAPYDVARETFPPRRRAWEKKGGKERAGIKFYYD
jgi:hypothetical protein